MEIVWAPEEIGEGRRFRVIVGTDRATTCTVTGGVALLDDVFTADRHRFYFRAVEPGEALLDFGDGAATVRVRVIVEVAWSDTVTRGTLGLPRVWRYDDPDVPLKAAHTIVDPGTIGASQGAKPSAPEALDWTYDELWGMEPPCDIPRWHFLNLDHGCPVHGLDIYESDPYYPWIVDVRNRPYAVQCPVGGEWYPTNDYAADDHTSGDFPDDGWGWHRTQPDGNVAIFGFISYWLLRRIRAVYNLLAELSAYYEATGDAEAARRMVVLLASLAREHRYLCRFPEHRFRRYECTVQEPQYRGTAEVMHGPRETSSPEDLGGGSGMDDYCINMPGQYVICARAYDLVFDRIDGDAELLRFLHANLPELTDGESVRRFVETFLFRAGAQVGLDDAMQSNLPEPQRGMISIIRALDVPQTAELTDWLVNGAGQVAAMPANYYYKDGAGYESTGGYNGHHVSALVPIEQGLRALRDAHPDRYPTDRFGANLVDEAGTMRYRDILTWPLDVVIAQLTHPFIGDTGDIPNTRALLPMPVMPMSSVTDVYRSAVERFPDDVRLRAVLEQLERRDDLIRIATKRQGKASGFYSGERPPEIDLRPDPRLWQESRLADGYGIAILESGDRDPDARRGVWMYYGDHPSHAHEQQLDIGLIAHRRNLIRHMGYPYSWQHMGEWDASWITHHTVKVVGSGDIWWRTTVAAFHPGSAGFQAVEVGGYGLNRERGDAQRVLADHRIHRSLLLVDVPPGPDGRERFYAVDMLGVTGGREHWWTFHGPPGEMSIEGTTLTPQDGGTVAGENVEYGGDTPDGMPPSLAYLYDVKRGGEPVAATWNLADADGLSVRVTQLAPEDGGTVIARGRSPHAPPENPPYELDWLLRHRSGGEGLSSEFVTLLESDADLPVRRAESRKIGEVTTVRVELNGCVHQIFRADGGEAPVDVDGVHFAGRYGFVETDDRGVIRRMVLSGEGVLTVDGLGIRSGARDWRGTIGRIDTAKRTVSIVADTAPPSTLTGSYLMVRRGATDVDAVESFAFRVESVERLDSGEFRCRLNWSPRVAAGTVKAMTETGIVHAGQMPLGASRTCFRDTDLVSASGRRFRVRDVVSSHRDKETTVTVHPAERERLAEVLAVGESFTIEEFGPGDEVVVAGFTEIVRDAEGRVEVTASGPAEIRL